MGHYQWAPGAHEGPQGRPVTTANKFSALHVSTVDEADKEADDEDKQVDEPRVHAEVDFGGHPGYIRGSQD